MAQNINIKNPWNGLRTYVEGEVIYGRNDEIQILSLLILQSNQTVVYGRSGIGKSSILNAGIFPLMREKGLFPVYVRFEHNVEKSYLDQIKDAILREVKKSGDKIRINKLVEKTNGESLWEFFHRVEYLDEEGNEVKPLIVFDQFEEIFTLENNKNKVNGFFRQLADLINNIKPEELSNLSGTTESPNETNAGDNLIDLGADLFNNMSFSYKVSSDYHLIFTLREDFLAYLEKNTTDIPALKNNRYCLQPINDEQAAEIIMSPREGLVDKEVAKLIIQKVTGEKDFEIDGVPEIQVDSAILSLYLSRLYDRMVEEGESKITTDLVEAHSANIIEDFYNDAIRNLPVKSIEWLEDTLINEEGRRDNRDKYTVLRDSGLTNSQLNALINDIKLLRQFSYGGGLRIEYIHDVLCPVIVKRRSKRLEDRRIEEIEERSRRDKIRARKRLVGISAIFVIITCAIIGIWLYSQYMNVWPYEKYYSDYTLKNGWPVGIGPELSESERGKTPLYYQLSHPGRKNSEFTKIQVLSSNQNPDLENITIPFLNTALLEGDSVSPTIRNLQSGIRTIEFKGMPNMENSKEGSIIDYIAFYDKNNDDLFTMKSSLENGNNHWFTFYDNSGRPMSLNSYNLDRIKVTYDSVGFLSSVLFYDNLGVRKPIARNLYGYREEVLKNQDNEESGIRGIFITGLNQFTEPSEESPNSIEISYSPNKKIYSYYNTNDILEEVTPMVNKKGYSSKIETDSEFEYYQPNEESPVAVMEIRKDDKGNITEYRLNKSDILRNIPPLTRLTYNDEGRIIRKELMDESGEPYSTGHAPYLWIYEFLPNGSTRYEEIVTDTGSIYLYKREMLADNVISTILKDTPRGITYVHRVDTVLNNEIVTALYDENNNPVNYYDGTQVSHKFITKENNGVKEVSFYVIEDGKIVPRNMEDTYFRESATFDSDGQITSVQYFGPEDEILQSLMYFYSDGTRVGQSVMGIDGTPVRCNVWDDEDMLYYKLMYNKSFDDAWSHFKVINEFGEPSTLKLELPGGAKYIKFGYDNFKNAEFNIGDVKKNVLNQNAKITNDYWQYYPEIDNNVSWRQAVYAHLLSKKSPLYEAGLRDGDIILKCGNWRIGESVEFLPEQLVKSSVLSVLRANENRTYDHVEIKNYTLTPEDLKLIHLHDMLMSKEENRNISPYLNKI